MNDMTNWHQFYLSRVNSTYQDYFNERYAAFITFIKGVRSNDTIFEAGCGIGSISKAVGGKFSGIDCDPFMVQLANTNTSSDNFREGDMFDMDYKGDVLTVTHGVLEHYEDDVIKRFLENCPNSIHYVPLDKYEKPSFGDERLLSVDYWLDLVKPNMYMTFNDGHDLAFYMK